MGKGKLTRTQEIWITALQATPIEVYVWRPAMIEEIEKILT